MKKLLSLLTLLVAMVTSAWAEDETIFSYTISEIPASQSAQVYEYDATGGKCSFNVTATSGNAGYFQETSEIINYNFGASACYVQVTLANDKTFKTGDMVIISGMCLNNNYASRGFYISTNNGSNNQIATTNFANRSAESNSLTATLDANYNGVNTLYIKRNGGCYFMGITIKREVATAPTITTQPVGGTYVSGYAVPARTVVATASAGELSYQWYSCDDAVKTNAAAIDGATTASYVPTASGFYFCRVTDSNGSTDTNVIEITISPAAAPSFVSITPSATSVVKGTASTITAEIAGNPAPTIQWYSNTVNNNTTGSVIDGATALTLNLANAAIGTFYYYAVAHNTEGDVASEVVTITVNGSNKCEMTNIKFSNGAYGAIATLADGAATVTVPYMAGQAEPTIDESSIKISANATKVIDGNTVTVTAEDGTTTGTYTITKTAFTPLAVTADVAATTFDAVPAWICNPYGYDASKGVKFAKKVDEASNMRIAKGSTRQYYFIGAAKTLTLTSGTGGARNIKVYRNGVELGTPTATAAANSTIDIALDQNAPCMIMIESNQTGGDGGFTKFAITASIEVSVTIGTTGWSTFSSAYGLDFSSATPAGLSAYAVTGFSGSALTKSAALTESPAETGLLLNGTAGETYTIPVKAGAASVGTNCMVASVAGGTVSAGEGSVVNYVLMNVGGNPVFQWIGSTSATLGANKAYLALTGGPKDPGARGLWFDDDMTTGINAVNGEGLNVQGAEVYNLNGQRVLNPTKGLYIVNGRKVIIK